MRKLLPFCSRLSRGCSLLSSCPHYTTQTRKLDREENESPEINLTEQTEHCFVIVLKYIHRFLFVSSGEEEFSCARCLSIFVRAFGFLLSPSLWLSEPVSLVGWVRLGACQAAIYRKLRGRQRFSFFPLLAITTERANNLFLLVFSSFPALLVLVAPLFPRKPFPHFPLCHAKQPTNSFFYSNSKQRLGTQRQTRYTYSIELPSVVDFDRLFVRFVSSC